MLKSKRNGPPRGLAKQAVVFVHGYGADGADLLGLSDGLAPQLPETVFFAPDAPQKSLANPMGFQWMPVSRLDGATGQEVETAMARSVVLLNQYLDKVLADEQLSADRLLLFGFSQGTMMSLHVALRRAEQLAGVVGFSGALLHAGRLPDEVVSKPPVLLLHGDADMMVPPESLPAAVQALRGSGIDVQDHVMQGVGHGISPEGLGIALGFMRARLAPE